MKMWCQGLEMVNKNDNIAKLIRKHFNIEHNIIIIIAKKNNLFHIGSEKNILSPELSEKNNLFQRGGEKNFSSRRKIPAPP